MNTILKNLKYDGPASLVVFFVALPLCLGIALASDAPIFSGLIAGIVGGTIVGALSGSKAGVSGPAAGLTAVVVSAIASLGSFDAFLLALVIAGAMQMLFGALKAGIVAYYFPSSVIKGMLSGIGIIIVLKQIPHAFGYDADYEGDLTFSQADGHNTISELFYMFDYITPGSIIISVASLGILLLWEAVLSKKGKIFSLIQGPLVVVAFGIIYEVITRMYFPGFALESEHLVTVPEPKGFGDFISQFTLPDFSQIGNSEIYFVAATIAVVASIETLLCVEATDKIDPKKRITPTNRELFAQGAGNMVSGLIGGLPVTQVIVRSSANIQSGANTKMSTILHGFLLLISIVTVPHILNLIPFASLASILLIVGYKLSKPSLFKSMFQLGWSQFIPFVATILGVVLTDLLTGIGLGLVIGIIVILKNNFKNSHFMHLSAEQNGKRKIKMTLAEEVSFLNKGAILNELNKIPSGSELTIDTSESESIDYDVKEIIENFKKTADSRNIEVIVKTDESMITADY